ncbi:GspH/FimT family pseudopilin [Sphingomonas sp. LHG3406-1]|uniref:GspH/FimT family pseudopilin n=1 Tax=Sphingomonas sp. LHG3406-1 TaxID=2804617 RepID=UPI00260F0163|nr:GspH/FimT family pseudopilin [Sphingomonas sp. LHG3406-1]
MPTSVATLPDPRREAGFTLVELLVVLAVMGLLAGIAVWRWPAGDERARTDAVALASRIAAARDQAILSGRPLALEVDQTGYRFEARSGGRWQPATDASLRERRWSGNVRPALPSPRVRLRFDSVGLPDSALSITLQGRQSRSTVEILADGEIKVG